ncbi:MAG: hypothetical protein Tsb009_14220 [Planctomycetaceae bacterium]
MKTNDTLGGTSPGSSSQVYLASFQKVTAVQNDDEILTTDVRVDCIRFLGQHPNDSLRISGLSWPNWNTSPDFKL